ncbi:hypothetical protein B0H13DRAFT_2346929 [Mycena leptocephala]|nr:hypothetical protein B0H13DRAFT_2346929 [Mycena leptocephala]
MTRPLCRRAANPSHLGRVARATQLYDTGSSTGPQHLVHPYHDARIVNAVVPGYCFTGIIAVLNSFMEFALAFTAGQPPGRVSDTGAPVRTSLTNSGEVNHFVLSAEGSKWQDRLWFIVVVL